LHPKLVRNIAKMIMRIAESGVQVFIATHSLFLLREFEILSKQFPKTGTRFFGLQMRPTGVEAQEADEIDDVGDLSLLDENLAQSERYLEMEDAQ